MSSSSVNAFKSSLQRSSTWGKIYMVPIRDFCLRPQHSSTSCVAALEPKYYSPPHTRTVYNPLFYEWFYVYVFGTLAFTPHTLVLCVAHPGNNAKTFVGPSCTDVDVDVGHFPSLLNRFHVFKHACLGRGLELLEHPGECFCCLGFRQILASTLHFGLKALCRMEDAILCVFKFFTKLCFFIQL